MKHLYVKSKISQKKGDIIKAAIYKAIYRESVMKENCLRIDIKGWI